jgi:putative spermidine/putrescine transport system permease protein
LKKVIIKSSLLRSIKDGENPEYLVALKNTAPNWSYAKYLKGVDLKFDENRNIIQQEEDRRIYKTLMV